MGLFCRMGIYVMSRRSRPNVGNRSRWNVRIVASRGANVNRWKANLMHGGETTYGSAMIGVAEDVARRRSVGHLKPIMSPSVD